MSKIIIQLHLQAVITAFTIIIYAVVACLSLADGALFTTFFTYHGKITVYAFFTAIITKYFFTFSAFFPTCVIITITIFAVFFSAIHACVSVILTVRVIMKFTLAPIVWHEIPAVFLIAFVTNVFHIIFHIIGLFKVMNFSSKILIRYGNGSE